VATKWDVYVRPAGSGPERRLATDFVFAGSPSWSPDGRQIAYFRYGGDSSTLLVMDVATARSREAWRGPLGINYGESWAADSRQLGFWSARGLVVLTDTVERLISRDTTHILSFPVFSPDGRQVVVHHLGPEGKGLWLVDLVSGAEARLLTGDGIIPIKWREDGNIYFLRSDSSLAAITLEVIRAAGGSVRVAGVFPRSSYDLQCDVSFLSLTSDLRTAVCSEAQSNSDIWVVDNFDQARR
jgi:Tol biopolymer transport system component